MVHLIAEKSSDGNPKALECGDAGELKVILCGTQADGTITPLKCDANGQLITIAGT